MPAVLREHVPSMLGVGLLLAACGHDLTPAQPRAAKLAFLVEPTRTEGTVPIKPGPQVIILDQFGDTVRDATNTVTVALGANPSGATLTGTTTVTAAAGVASFSDLHIDRPGSGYTLLATAPGLAGAMSVAFRIGLTIAALSAGDHTCAVTTVGASYCWGFNSAGQLGDGTTDRKSTPVLVIMPAGVRFAAVSAGGDHTCGVTPSGTAYCWGWNQDGQLGDGTRVDRRTPVPVAAPAGVGFAAVSLGGRHTCGVTLGGTAYCWGHNAYGQLGDGTDTSRTIPVAVSVPRRVELRGGERGLLPHVRPSDDTRGVLLGRCDGRLRCASPHTRGHARGCELRGGEHRGGSRLRPDSSRFRLLLGRQ